MSGGAVTSGVAGQDAAMGGMGLLGGGGTCARRRMAIRTAIATLTKERGSGGAHRIVVTRTNATQLKHG
jgi:hypothetical protein